MNRRTRFSTLEVGRGVAALLVVLFHFGSIVEKYFGSVPSISVIFLGGHAGVEYFFGLSGFIIYSVHIRDIGQPKKLAEFIKKRTIRILPMYWLVITLMLSAFIIHPSWGSEKLLDAGKVVRDYLLIPRSGALLLPPAWTLEREMLFYIVFCVIIVSPKIGLWAFCSWQFAIVLFNMLLFLLDIYPNNLLWFFFGIHNFGFLVGAGCAWALANLNTPRSGSALALIFVGIFGGVATMACESVGGFGVNGAQSASQEIGQSLLYTLSFGFLIYGCASSEERHAWKAGRYLSLLGASSYVIYLIHEPMGSLILKIFSLDVLRDHIGPNAGYVVSILIVLGASVTLHLRLEKPLTNYLRRKLIHDHSRDHQSESKETNR